VTGKAGGLIFRCPAASISTIIDELNSRLRWMFQCYPIHHHDRGYTVVDPTDKKMLKKQSQMAGKDIISAAFVMGLGIIVSVWALFMPRPSGWSSAPGLVPLLFAGSMTLMGLGLLISALRRNAIAHLRQAWANFSIAGLFRETQTKRTLWIVVLSAIYTLVLSGRVPFEIAGTLFLLGTLTVFWRKGGWLKILLISGCVPITFSLMFRLLFAILVPGDSILDYLLYR
jgi:hypothetical protein